MMVYKKIIISEIKSLLFCKKGMINSMIKSLSAVFLALIILVSSVFGQYFTSTTFAAEIGILEGIGLLAELAIGGGIVEHYTIFRRSFKFKFLLAMPLCLDPHGFKRHLRTLLKLGQDSVGVIGYTNGYNSH